MSDEKTSLLFNNEQSTLESNNSTHKIEGPTKKQSLFELVKRFLKFLGPAVLISVGYVGLLSDDHFFNIKTDPGNWATDIAGGSLFQYRLLWVLALSNAIALVIQSLAAKLGLVTGFY